MPPSTVWNTPDLVPLAYDPPKALNLLKAAGWEKNANGILEQAGREFKFELATYSSRPMLPLVAEALQANFLNTGIKMKIIVGKYSIIPGRFKHKTMEASLIARNFGMIPDPIGNLNTDYGPGKGPWGSLG